jgi:adenylate kinase
LSKKHNALHIDLSVYAEKNDLILEYDKERDTYIVDIEAINEKLREVAEMEQFLIIDGHYSHEIFIDQQVKLVIILRMAPWKLYQILRERIYSNQKIWENIEAEILGVIPREVQKRFANEKIHEIDTSYKTPEEAANEIISILLGKIPRSFKPIDWIEYPETMDILVKRNVSNY